MIQPNALICLTQMAYNKFRQIVRPGGLLITDTRFVETSRKTDATQVELALYKSVMDQIGKPIVFNICMLGAVLQLTNLVSPDSIMKALETRIPERLLEMNQKALELGMKLAETENASVPKS